jgi:hypothetical protein
MMRREPEEISVIEQSAYFGMCLMPKHLLEVAKATSDEHFKEYVCQLLINMQQSADQPALHKLADASSVRFYIDLFLDTIAAGVPEELVESLRHTDRKIRLLAARSLYVESGGLDQEAYDLIQQLLDAGPAIPDAARAEYLEALDAQASKKSNGD